jgi:Protein of unknown function (DUF2891)
LLQSFDSQSQFSKAYNILTAMLTMTSELADQFARSTLGHVGREYPNGLSLTLNEPTMVSPSALHPIFFGSFDWHSCVHGWWQLFRLARLFPSFAGEIYARAEAVFTPENVAGELEYLIRHPGFERPYGWGWFLALHGESGQFQEVLEPLARQISKHLAEYLPRLTYPVRAGTHANTAFALILAYDWALEHDSLLANCISDWAGTRFTDDVTAAHIEPSGEDFLSPTLTEAVLMSRVLPAEAFTVWMKHFMPDLPKNLLEPVTISDRSDGRIGHLDGLNLSRAWCWRCLIGKTSFSDAGLESYIEQHLSAALPHVEANYMSEHWLCSFALLALS